MTVTLERDARARRARSTARPPQRHGGPAAGIDPRFVRRIDDLERKRKRKRHTKLSILILVTAALIAGLLVARSPLLSVSTIRVTGAGRTGAALVVDASRLAEGDPMTAVDPAAVAAQIERLPWVADARVERDWPSTVRISVIERVPVAVAGAGLGRMLVDRDGWVLGPAGAGTSLPSVGSLRPDDTPGHRLRPAQRDLVSVVTSMPADALDDVVWLDKNPVGIRALLTNGVLVVLGDDTQIRAKFAAVDAVLANIDPATIEVIDASVASFPTLTRTMSG